MVASRSLTGRRSARVAGKLAAGEPVVIIAFGSSSTAGFGATSPEFNYPNRLAAQLHRQYPSADITVINRGQGGEDAPEMMKRLQTSVIDMHPDLVIWQVGTNAVLRNLDPAETIKLVEDGVARIQATGADLVLIDPQYSPRVNERAESAGKMINLLNKVAELRKVGIFPRFEVMRDWHENQSIPVESFVILPAPSAFSLTRGEYWGSTSTTSLPTSCMRAMPSAIIFSVSD